jgi:hypothetical protein
MSRILRCATGASLAWAMAAGLSAQAPPSPQQHGADDRSATHVTISGCIERADEVPIDASATTVDSLTFVLITAASASASPASTTPVATTGTTESGTLGRTYRLDAPVDRLNPHVGHKVEVTGNLEDAPTEPAGAGSPSNPPRLRVETVKMLDATCPR